MADIAREAGVSMATASRALSGARGVSAATTAHVRSVAEQLSYVVSPEASNLSRRATGRVGVVTTHISRWFFGEVIEGIESTLSARGLDTVVYGVGGAEDRRRFFEHLPARRKVDAVIVVGMPVSRAEQERLALLDVAVVAAGGQVADYPFASIDDELAGQQAMNHLLFLGHRRIAMIDAIDPNEEEWPIELRSRAYTDAIAAAGADTDPNLFVRVPWGAEGGAEGMERLLSLPEPPTAVFAHSDEMAFGAMQTLRRAGLEIPRDISMIGIDDHPVSALLDLTTIHQDARAQGVAAAKTVCATLDGTEPDPAVLVPTRLVPRGSTAAPRQPGSA
jgi:LacI family transcriptional regulator, repressor for deo operon, udp, cdd, tsx, nupC, and nupG